MCVHARDRRDWRNPHVPGANPGVDLDWDPNQMAQKVYYADEFAADIASSGHNIVQTVYMECGMGYKEEGPVGMRRVGETEFAQSQAQPDIGMVDGLVGSVNLQLGGEEVDAILAAHLTASPNFKGIRTAFPEDLNEQWCAQHAQHTIKPFCFSFHSATESRAMIECGSDGACC